MATETLWDTEDTAAYLKLSAKTVERMAREGQLPVARRIGRSYRFDPSRVREWAGVPDNSRELQPA